MAALVRSSGWRKQTHRERGDLPRAFPLALKPRGLKGVELVVSDDYEGLKAAVSRHIQGPPHQRFQVHYSRNFLGMVGPTRRKELAADLRAVFADSEIGNRLSDWRLR
jgi:transposase-like protein